MSRTLVEMAEASLECTPHGRPRLLHWGARTYRVTDSPTRLEDALDAMLTHPLPVHGWRFQGTSTDVGETLVFDVLLCGDGWRVLRTYR